MRFSTIYNCKNLISFPKSMIKYNNRNYYYSEKDMWGSKVFNNYDHKMWKCFGNTTSPNLRFKGVNIGFSLLPSNFWMHFILPYWNVHITVHIFLLFKSNNNGWEWPVDAMCIQKRRWRIHERNWVTYRKERRRRGKPKGIYRNFMKN